MHRQTRTVNVGGSTGGRGLVVEEVRVNEEMVWDAGAWVIGGWGWGGGGINGHHGALTITCLFLVFFFFSFPALLLLPTLVSSLGSR